MQIYLARNNQQAGPYSVEQLNQMLASQQVLLTDLIWHQGLAEWKALGELTQGQFVYYPAGYTAPDLTNTAQSSHAYHNPTITHTHVNRPSIAENASIGKRFFAKILDLFLWLPIIAIPAFFMDEQQVGQLDQLQKNMQAATNPDQMSQLQTQFFQLIPTDAWMMMVVYVVIMLAIQGYLLAKSGQSIGKRIAKIKIVDATNDTQVSLLRAFTLRTVVFILFTILFFPFITIVDSLFILGQKRQTLHDKLAKTRVIKQ